MRSPLRVRFLPASIVWRSPSPCSTPVAIRARQPHGRLQFFSHRYRRGKAYGAVAWKLPSAELNKRFATPGAGSGMVASVASAWCPCKALSRSGRRPLCRLDRGQRRALGRRRGGRPLRDSRRWFRGQSGVNSYAQRDAVGRQGTAPRPVPSSTISGTWRFQQCSTRIAVF